LEAKKGQVTSLSEKVDLTNSSLETLKGDVESLQASMQALLANSEASALLQELEKVKAHSDLIVKVQTELSQVDTGKSQLLKDSLKTNAELVEAFEKLSTEQVESEKLILHLTEEIQTLKETIAQLEIGAQTYAESARQLELAHKAKIDDLTSEKQVLSEVLDAARQSAVESKELLEASSAAVETLTAQLQNQQAIKAAVTGQEAQTETDPVDADADAKDALRQAIDAAKKELVDPKAST
jgi:chromosome segregation ATPase